MVSDHIDKRDINIQNYSFAKIPVVPRFRLIGRCSIVAKLSRLRMVRPQFRGRPFFLKLAACLQTAFFRRALAVPSRIDVDEIPQQRIDFGVPLPAAEDSVVADAGLHVMHLAIGAHAGAEILRGQRLPD